MDTPGHILMLPMEILLLIAEKLKGNEIVSFSRACQRFAETCSNLRKLVFADDFYLNEEEVKTFFRNCVKVKMLSVCDFTNCYHISSKILSPAIEKCTNLRVLRVTNTNLTCNLMGKILVKCTQLEQLSLSVRVKDFWLKNSPSPEALDKVLPQSPVGCPWERLLKLTYFKDSEETLKNLKKLDFHIPPDSVILGVILSACQNLEHLKLSVHGDVDPSSFYGRLSMRKLERIFVHPMKSEMNLKSFVLHLPTEDCITRFEITSFISCHIVKSNQTDHFKCFWAEQLPPPAVGKDLSALACNDIPDIDQIEPISTLRSLKTTDYLSGSFFAPDAKQIECLYTKTDSQRFEEFCQVHQQLSRLKLNIRDSTSRIPAHWYLPHLTALSIDPSLVNEAGLLRSILVSSKEIEELEICSFTFQSATKAKLRSDELSLIGKLSKLRSLTLGNFLIDSGHFFQEILKNCSNLKCLRLNGIGPDALCSYTKYLCSSLLHAHQLTRIRIKQNNMTPLGQLLKSLEKCSSLVQLSLIVPSKAPPNLLSHFSGQKDQAFSRFLIHFVDCLPKMTGFYMALSQPAAHCSVATKLLSNKFHAERPAFSCAIVNLPDVVPLITVGRVSLHGHLPTLQTLERPSLPSIHTEFLFDCYSKVCDLPYC